MIKKRLDTIFIAAQSYKKPLSIIIDTILLIVSLFLAYLIRLGSIEAIGTNYFHQIFVIALILVPI